MVSLSNHERSSIDKLRMSVTYSALSAIVGSTLVARSAGT